MVDEMTPEEIGDAIFTVLQLVKEAKPEEPGEEARNYAVTATMLEQAYAYFRTYVCDY